MSTSQHQSPPSYVLDYQAPPARRRARRRITADDCVAASMTLGVLAWLTMMLLLAGGWWPCVPLGLAATGLLLGAGAGVNLLSRDAGESMIFAVFLNFLVIGLWVLALALL